MYAFFSKMKTWNKIKLLCIVLIPVVILNGCGGNSESNDDPSNKQLTGKLLPPEDNQIYFGAFTNFTSQEDDVTEDKIRDFDELAGKPIAWSYFSNNWTTLNVDNEHSPEIRYPKEDIHEIASLGKTPFVRLMPWTSPHILIGDASKAVREADASEIVILCHQQNANESPPHSTSILATHSEAESYLAQGDTEGACYDDFSMQSIIDGNWDADLREWAISAKNDRDEEGNPIPLLVTFSVEMNGYWFPWSGIYNGGSTTDGYGDPSLADGPERFRDAYRHIIDLFRHEEVNNITWFFVPDTIDKDKEWVSFIADDWNDPINYYPGDDYIDWVGMNLYGATGRNWAWSWFSDGLQQKYKTIEQVRENKPLALLEFGVMENHSTGNKSEWLEDAFDTILSGNPLDIQAISYWNDAFDNGEPNGTDLTIDSSEATLLTFRDLISNPRFTSELRFSE